MSSSISRREFLQTAVATSVAFAAPMIIPASALGRDGKTAPSERLVLGAIGTGGKGQNNIGTFLGFPDVQVVAVCDVDRTHAEAAAKSVNKSYNNEDCKSFQEYQELLALKDLDAVCISTPDHWHALASVAAANAGKDIYCEKPLANSIGEGRAICEAVSRNQRILQTGSHERSNPKVRYACELVKRGHLGHVGVARVQMPTDQPHHLRVRSMTEMPKTEPVPDGFDYDFWLGHTPVVPYTPDRCHFWWRFILAYGGGEMTDRGAHIIDLAQLAFGTDDTGRSIFKRKGSIRPLVCTMPSSITNSSIHMLTDEKSLAKRKALGEFDSRVTKASCSWRFMAARWKLIRRRC